MHCRPSANRRFLSLAVQVLRGDLLTTTTYLKLLKSRIGLTLSLFNCYRLTPDRMPVIVQQAGPVRQSALYPHG